MGLRGWAVSSMGKRKKRWAGTARVAFELARKEEQEIKGCPHAGRHKGVRFHDQFKRRGN